jgi:hypothetical protein
MNPGKIERTVTAALPSTAPSRTFIVILFAGAVIIGAVIAYLGIIGAIGGPIP